MLCHVGVSSLLGEGLHKLCVCRSMIEWIRVKFCRRWVEIGPASADSVEFWPVCIRIRPEDQTEFGPIRPRFP